MTVVDTSAVVDYLLGSGASAQVEDLMSGEGEVAAPDLLTFEVLAVLRRAAARDRLSVRRAGAAIADLGDAPIQLFPSLSLRRRAWELRRNLTAADALFVALAEQLGEPLATKDLPLARAAERHADVRSLPLGSV